MLRRNRKVLMASYGFDKQVELVGDVSGWHHPPVVLVWSNQSPTSVFKNKIICLLLLEIDHVHNFNFDEDLAIFYIHFILDPNDSLTNTVSMAP